MIVQRQTNVSAHDVFARAAEALFCYRGVTAKAIQFVLHEQLLCRPLWRRFARQFHEPDADFDGGWRGEYWGKMMMGACYLCEAGVSDELYGVLEETVRDILAAQRPDGAISSYAEDHELSGWDMWCRKYVMIGLEYFLPLCRDQALARAITESLCRQMDAILAKTGPGKRDLCAASGLYRGLNASSILEPVVLLYRLTGQSKYLDFAEYIVGRGGTSVFDIFGAALEDRLLPYQYPITKAYEMISCFEGLLELYRATGDENCKRAALRFADRLLETDVTVIGSCGCTHEFLDHSANRQASEDAGPLMQETCVTVSLMKLMAQAAQLTGDAVYSDAFERALYNAYLGALNTRRVRQPSLRERDAQLVLEPLPFDSYSPLTRGRRGREVGGFQILSDHHFYGCCASIGPAGCGLVPRMQLFAREGGLVLNLYAAARIQTAAPSGAALTLEVDTDYPASGEVAVTLQMEQPERFTLWLRVPAWSANTRADVNGEVISAQTGYLPLTRLWRSGDCVHLSLDMRVRRLAPTVYEQDILHTRMVWELDYMVPVCDRPGPQLACHAAFLRGPLALAAQQRTGWIPERPLALRRLPDGNPSLRELPAAPDRLAAVALALEDGGEVILTDYAGAGKFWEEDDQIAVWLSVETPAAQGEEVEIIC